jgi:hypothetical protein
MNCNVADSFISTGSDIDSLNSFRASDSNIDTLSCANTDKTIHDNDDIGVKNNMKIYRYNFRVTFIEQLYKFSKIHQYDDRKSFKEAWEIWLETNNELVTEETDRLIRLGYTGNIVNKMYKSARFYFRKKSTEKKAPKKRGNYIGITKQLLDAIDLNIKSLMSEPNFKPSDGFDKFCNQNIDLLKEEVKLLISEGISNSEVIKKKIKKTYKNRCFIIINQIK